MKREFEGGNFTTIARKNEEISNLIRRFMRLTQKEKLIEEVLEHSNYKKPSVKHRERHLRSLRLQQKIRDRETMLDKLMQDR